jgi:hypothetical protein
MSIKAIAFHEVVAMDKIREFFKSPESQQESETQAATCAKCNLAFAIVLTAKDDPRNSEYLRSLNSMIADDCIAGHHKEEYIFGRIGRTVRLN